MSHGTLVFVLALAGSILSGACLSVLCLLIFRETQQTLAFDRRLAVLRERALTAAPRPDARGSRRAEARFSPRAFGLALTRAGSMLVPIGAAEREKLAGVLRRAGFGQRDALALFLSAKLASALALGAAAGLFAAHSERIGQYPFLVAVLAVGGLIAGGLVPEYVLRALGNRRTRRMSAALPDALDLIVMCLESGLTFERALATVAEELVPINADLAGEFRLIEAELRLGSSRRDVLQDFERRTDVEGLRDLARTLAQSDRYGTPLTQSMRNIAADERLQRAARIGERAERLPVMMSLPMMLFVVPGTMLLVAGPAFLSAIKSLGAIGGG